MVSPRMLTSEALPVRVLAGCSGQTDFIVATANTLAAAGSRHPVAVGVAGAAVARKRLGAGVARAAVGHGAAAGVVLSRVARLARAERGLAAIDQPAATIVARIAPAAAVAERRVRETAGPVAA